MARRTTRDVRRFCTRPTYIDNGTKYGALNTKNCELSQDRIGRFLDHEWFDTDLALSKDGKAILMHWENTDNPEDRLSDIGAQRFINEALDENYRVQQSGLTADRFHGMKIRENVPDELSVPQGHEDYHPREIRAGKNDVEIAMHQLRNGNHLEFKGETGTGKTELAKFLAQMLNTGAEQVNFSEEVRVSHLFGHYEVHEGDNGGTEMEWVDGVFTKCVRHGGWFIADEHDMMDGDVSSILHSALERGDAQFTIPEKGEVIDVHEDFRYIGTSNPGYAGTNQKNKAFDNRVHSIPIEYLDQEKEVDIVMEAVGLADDRRDDVKSLVAVGRELRSDYLNGSVPKPITPRSMIRAAQFLKDDFMDPENAAKTAYADDFPKQGGHRSAVKTTIENSQQV